MLSGPGLWKLPLQAAAVRPAETAGGPGHGQRTPQPQKGSSLTGLNSLAACLSLSHYPAASE